MEDKRLSLEDRLRDAPSSVFDQTHVIFGGTGAVGGQTAIQMIEWYQDIYRYMSPDKRPTDKQVPTLVLTGASEEEITKYIDKLEKIDTINIKAGVKLDGPNYGYDILTESGVRIIIEEFRAEPSFGDGDGIEALLNNIDDMKSPFEEFLHKYQDKLSAEKFTSVISGIPIASMATYGKKLEAMFTQFNITDKEEQKTVKEALLRSYAKKLGEIKGTIADDVLAAHTTAVGGMYHVNKDGKVTINIPFAHSSSGEKLKQKRYFAQLLTEEYSKLGIKNLITAAAIGINYIDSDTTIPYTSEIREQLETANVKGIMPRHVHEDGKVTLLPYNTITWGKKSSVNLTFNGGVHSHPESENPLTVNQSLDSGENGQFSVSNTLALYLSMKVATQEELAIPLASTAMFGDDPNMPWFTKRGDNENVCYYVESENTLQVFSLLNNNSQLKNESFNPFSLQAYQALGSSKHQSELHTLGLYNLLHRMLELRSESESTPVGTQLSGLLYDEKNHGTMKEWLAKNTARLNIEDVASMNADALENDFANLVTITNAENLCNLLNLDYNELNNAVFSKNLGVLADCILEYVASITSIGTPIIYKDKEQEKILAGPYVAPFDKVMATEDTMANFVSDKALELGADEQDLFNWYVANNGFVDLRKEARVTTAKSVEENKGMPIQEYNSHADFETGVKEITSGYFTSSGITAMVGRMRALEEHLSTFDLSLGSKNAWLGLFKDDDGKHPLVPGVIEYVRICNEGFKKSTGIESNEPGYGYFKPEQIVRDVKL